MKMDFNSEKVLAALIRNNRVASLGTIRDSVPNVSMVLFYESKDFTSFFIHISQLARHTQNISQNPNVSLMISESDALKKNPQSLSRISLTGEAVSLDKNSKLFEEMKNQYLNKYPDSKLNFQLGDFNLFEIKVQSARFVAGFGKIYSLHKEDLKKASQN